MNSNTKFLTHIQKSCEIVSAWPSWKTAMWGKSTEKNTTKTNEFIISTKTILDLNLNKKKSKKENINAI